MAVAPESHVADVDGVKLHYHNIAQFTVFTRCGHWVQWEKVKAFNALVASSVGGELS